MSKDDKPDTIDHDDFLAWLNADRVPDEPIERAWQRLQDATRDWDNVCQRFTRVTWRDKRTGTRRPATDTLEYLSPQCIANSREEAGDDDVRFLQILGFHAEQKAFRETLANQVPAAKPTETLVPEAINEAIPEAPTVRSVIVCPAFPAVSHSEKKASEAYKHIIAAPLPVAVAADIMGVRQRLVSEQPWAADAIDAMLSPTFRNWSTGRADIRIGPVLLFGPPGTGKSRLARRVCEELGIGYRQTSSAGSYDDHLLGVSKGWASAAPSIVLSAISDHRIANPVLIIDEIEKALRGQNGDLIAKLLPLLEKSEASRWLEPFIGAPIDASCVSWIFTANSVDTIPDPLKSRLRIVRVPTPGPQHIGVIIRRVLDEIADENGVDRRWYPGFDAEIVDVLRSQLAEHGSVRILRRQIEAALDTSPLSRA